MACLGDEVNLGHQKQRNEKRLERTDTFRLGWAGEVEKVKWLSMCLPSYRISFTSIAQFFFFFFAIEEPLKPLCLAKQNIKIKPDILDLEINFVQNILFSNGHYNEFNLLPYA
jgi:hypothetical protein